MRRAGSEPQVAPGSRRILPVLAHQVVGRLSWGLAGEAVASRPVLDVEWGEPGWLVSLAYLGGVQLQPVLGLRGVEGCPALVWKRFEGVNYAQHPGGWETQALALAWSARVAMVPAWQPPEWCRVLVLVLRVWRIAPGGF